MNHILQLKGKFKQRKNTNSFGPINLPKGSIVTEKHIYNLKMQLICIRIHPFEEQNLWMRCMEMI